MCGSVEGSGKLSWFYSNNVGLAFQPCEWVTDVPEQKLTLFKKKHLSIS